MTRATYVLSLAIALLAGAVVYHARQTAASVQTSRDLHMVLREIQAAGFGEPESP